jgi:MFS transporter, SP family, general alpha glucoside:H+ symporter
MSVKFNEKYVLGEEVEHHKVEDGQGPNIYARRMSRKGSVVNPHAHAPPAGVLVNSDRAYSVVAETIPEFTDLHDEAREHTEKETSMGFLEGIKTYPNAAAWSILLSSSIIMEGYDTNLLGSFFAFPIFNQKYGQKLPDGQYQVPAAWQTGLMNGVQVGSMIGLAINGIMCDRIGYKKTYFFALTMMIVFIFLPFFAPNNGVLLAGQVLSGIPWGMFQTLSVAYASEVCPVALRGYLTTYANICWVIGQVLSSGVLRGFLSRTDQWVGRENCPFELCG